MFLDEISLAENNAPLVVLSACNTTTGEIQTGEGVMSLARGFFYGGTQSTVSSLWQIDDRATNIIIEVFYKNLKNVFRLFINIKIVFVVLVYGCK